MILTVNLIITNLPNLAFSELKRGFIIFKSQKIAWDQFDENTEIHLSRLREEGRIFESVVPLISRLTVPSLLILGENDPVTCERHVRAYHAAPQGKIKIFEGCGHTPHKERPELYKNVVIDYICYDSNSY